MSGCGQESLPDDREWSRGPSGCPAVDGRPSRMTRSGREAPMVVERPTRMPGSGRAALSDVQYWSGGPPRCPGVVERPSRKSRSGREAL